MQLICVHVRTPIASSVTGVVLFFSLPFIFIFDILKERIFFCRKAEKCMRVVL